MKCAEDTENAAEEAAENFKYFGILLSTCIRKYGNVFITWFIHSIYAKV
jgi:hypothetical protein